MSPLNQGYVGVSVEKVVLLHQQSVLSLLLFIEIPDSLNVSLLKVLFLHFREDNILLFELSEPEHKDFQVFLHFLGILGFYLSGYSLNVADVILSDTLNESLILFFRPVKESSGGELSKPFFIILRYNLVIILSVLDLSSQGLQLLKVIKELKLEELRDPDSLVLSLLLLLFTVSFGFLQRHLMIKILIYHHGLIKVVV